MTLGLTDAGQAGTDFPQHETLLTQGRARKIAVAVSRVMIDNSFPF
jgi:hypothetical protein